MDQRLCELVPDASSLLCACWRVIVGAVGEGCALTLGIAGVVWDIGAGKLDLGFLLRGCVGGGSEGGEAVEEVLFVVLVDQGGKGLEGGEDMVAY